MGELNCMSVELRKQIFRVATGILLGFMLAGPCVAEDSPLPLSPAEAARSMVVPDGFNVTLFAGEPDVKQPIGFCIDDRGRLWVAEAYNYPNHGDRPGDRILILEDADGDGRFDKRTVFYDKLNYVTGIEVGFGGAWVMSPPYFYFIADRDGDDRPDGDPQILLDGFGNHANAHNLANAFAWGPDGWLYGTHGRTNWSLLGKPGASDDERMRFDGGVYRYHPVRHVWEPFADGTTNPWGIDFDDYGQGFVCNCVNPHLFHVIQGAHYEPWRNRESSRHAYERIATIADHLHFVGRNNVRDGLGSDAEDVAGGGHAHCGTMVYLGDNWPDRFRNTVFMNNIHGRRINNDILRRSGSGYLASHGRDFMRSNDPWYMGVTILFGPDGAVFASDWSDTGECHSRKNTRRHTGRIYKIAYGQPNRGPVDLARLDDQQLVQLQRHRNDWHVRHARRLLQERAADGHDMAAVRSELFDMFDGETDLPRKLRALWALHAIGALDDSFLLPQLDHQSEYVRAWAVRLLCEDRELSAAALTRLRSLAAVGDSSFVRLHLASALQRLEPDQRWAIAAALASRSEDANDANLPLMIWYGIEPLVHEDVQRFVALAAHSSIPLIRRHIARRVASLTSPADGINALTGLLHQSEDPDGHRDLLAGLLKGFEGRRSVAMPNGWQVAYRRLRMSADDATRDLALRLAVIYDDPAALGMLRQRAADASASVDARTRAIQALVAKKDRRCVPVLLDLVLDVAVRNAALRGLAEFNDPATVTVILENYAALDESARQNAVQTLASRPSWAMHLLDSVAAEQIPRSDLTAYTIRQLHNLGSDRLADRIQTVWGNVRTTADDRSKLISKYKKQLTPDRLADANLPAGRGLFQKNCASCHRLFDAGENVGPDITGAQRRNLDYVLENLIDPNAAVAKDFQMEIIVTATGRTITGLVTGSSERALTIQTVNEKIVLPLDEIEQRSTSDVSMMPDGVVQKLSSKELCDLIAYLASPIQVPLEAGSESLPSDSAASGSPEH